MKAGRATSGFTLLEVLVAIAILGLGLTVVLSAQTGVFWSYSRATRMSQAPGLVRCKMEELELELLTKGYPVVDESDEGDCCEESELSDYHCSWTVERVELPNLMLDDPLAGDAGAAGDGLGGGEDPLVDPDTELGDVDPGGALSSLPGAGMLGESGGLGGPMGMMGGTGAGGSSDMVAMVMSMVYPSLKPMLEASIRKLTVTVHWQEGRFERDMAVTQYVTNPMQGGFDPMTGAMLDALTDQADQEPDAPLLLPGAN